MAELVLIQQRRTNLPERMNRQADEGRALCCVMEVKEAHYKESLKAQNHICARLQSGNAAKRRENSKEIRKMDLSCNRFEQRIMDYHTRLHEETEEVRQLKRERNAAITDVKVAAATISVLTEDVGTGNGPYLMHAPMQDGVKL